VRQNLGDLHRLARLDGGCDVLGQHQHWGATKRQQNSHAADSVEILADCVADVHLAAVARWVCLRAPDTPRPCPPPPRRSLLKRSEMSSKLVPPSLLRHTAALMVTRNTCCVFWGGGGVAGVRVGGQQVAWCSLAPGRPGYGHPRSSQPTHR
jgi:hypothetical protein